MTQAPRLPLVAILPPMQQRSPERYELGRLLGKGGMGAVYLARDRETGREVALKLLRQDALQRDPSLAATLAVEIRAAAKLSHPNIVPLYDAGLAGEAPFLAMKYARGGSLSSLVAARATRSPPGSRR